LVVLRLVTCVFVKACTCPALSAANTDVDKAFTWSVDMAVIVSGLSANRSAVVMAATSDVLHEVTGFVAPGIEA